MKAVIALAAALLAGCGTPAATGNQVAAPTVKLAPPQSIRISYGTCFGSCPIFTVTVSASGKGTFEGVEFTAVSGTRHFAVSREQFATVATALESFRITESRPIADLINGPGKRDCDSYVTDNASRTIVWAEAEGSERAMLWDTGCKAKRYEGLQTAIDKALAVLPVAPWMVQKD